MPMIRLCFLGAHTFQDFVSLLKTVAKINVQVSTGAVIGMRKIIRYGSTLKQIHTDVRILQMMHDFVQDLCLFLEIILYPIHTPHPLQEQRPFRTKLLGQLIKSIEADGCHPMPTRQRKSLRPIDILQLGHIQFCPEQRNGYQV